MDVYLLFEHLNTSVLLPERVTPILIVSSYRALCVFLGVCVSVGPHASLCVSMLLYRGVRSLIASRVSRYLCESTARRVILGFREGAREMVRGV